MFLKNIFFFRLVRFECSLGLCNDNNDETLSSKLITYEYICLDIHEFELNLG